MKLENAKKKVQKYFDLIKKEVPESKLYRSIHQCSGVITDTFLDYYSNYGGDDHEFKIDKYHE